MMMKIISCSEIMLAIHVPSSGSQFRLAVRVQSLGPQFKLSISGFLTADDYKEGIFL